MCLPYTVQLNADAFEDLSKLDQSDRIAFSKHLKKFESLPPRRHLGPGLHYFIENAGQGRIVCKVEGSVVTILHIFRTHKEYKKWFRKEMK